MLEKQTQWVANSLLTIILAIATLSCDSDGDADRLGNLVLVADEGYQQLQILEAPSVISVNQSEILIVSAVTEDGTAVEVSTAEWSSSDNSIATVANGVVTGGSVDGTAVITARLGNLFTSEPIRVSSAGLSSVGIEFDSEVLDLVRINECDAAQFEALGFYAGEEESRIETDVATWSVSQNNASFDPYVSGLLRTFSTGNLEVSARLVQSRENGDIVETGTQSVLVGDNLVGIDIRSDAGELAVGSPLQFRAYGLYEDGSETEITDNALWDIEDDATSDFASVDPTLPAKGLVTADRAGAGVLRVSCGGITETLNISSGNGDLIDQVVINRTSPFTVDFDGSELIVNLRANAMLNGRIVEDVTEDSEWRTISADNNISLSDDDGSKGRITITGVGEIEIEVTYIDDDETPFTSPSLRIIAE